MSLFSDVDWVILLLAGGLLLMGGHGMEVFRTLGKYYGKFLRIRQQLMFEFQSQVLGPEPSPGNSPLPTLMGPTKPPVVPPSTASVPPTPAPVPAGTVAAAPPPDREAQKGPSFPSEGAEMYR
ncbi:MAG: hypothetical protein KGJ23_04215 [Euryarchaeota archaeon]|nr:hypothetical protein [Euryarchaeota archaeon]MDE1835804.1 hypothetical protein [Euryarchaeota archaeon]MDE1880722.1 hypothetical protein [Euryarchaeota archaeon]MDE2043995.1 hypothetical protein [Thermoplasmata archaeon]